MIKKMVSLSTREKIEAVQERIELKWMLWQQRGRFGFGQWAVVILLSAGLAYWMLAEKTKELDRITLAMTTDRGMEPVGFQNQETGQSTSLPDDWEGRFEIERKQVPDYERTGIGKKQYRELERKEFLPEVMREAPNRKLEVGEDKPQHETIHTYDKDLVLAGRGYEIGRFQKEAQLRPKLNPVHIPEPKLIEQPGTLHSSNREGVLTEARQHSFVRHNRATGFHTGYNVEPFIKGKQTMPPPPQTVKPIPETRLILDVGKKTELRLIPNKDRLDLLRGDPNINRHLYQKRFGKPILTSKAITNGSSKKSTKTR